MKDTIPEYPGFTEKRADGVVALLRSSLAAELGENNILDPMKFFSHCEATDFTGRATPFRLRLASGATAIVRRYRRGGMARILLRDRYLGPSRPLSELGVSEHIRASGVPTPEVLAAVHMERPLLMHSGFIVTDEIRDARPLRVAVSQGDQSREVLVRDAARLFRTMHDSGVAHPDLTVDNVLVREDGGVVLVDLDGCSVSQAVDPQRRLKDLLRFRRSARKNSLGVDIREWSEFFQNYADDDAEIGLLMDPWLRAFDRRLFWYRLAWRIGV